jgi:hypothetical protein
VFRAENGDYLTVSADRTEGNENATGVSKAHRLCFTVSTTPGAAALQIKGDTTNTIISVVESRREAETQDRGRRTK